MAEAFLPFTTPALIGVALTAALLAAVNDWRVGLTTLGVQFACAAVLITQIGIWQVALAKLSAGLLAVGILALTGRQVHYGRTAEAAAGQGGEFARAGSLRIDFPTNLPFRVAATLMIAVFVWATATRPEFALPGLPLALNIACYVLLALGLLNLGLTEEPMNAGFGLLTVLTGFGIMYAAVEPALLIVGLLAAVDFGIALAISYLTLIRFTASQAERRP